MEHAVPSLADRLLSLLDHLGIARAHLATQMPADIGDLCTAAADRIAGVVLAVPVRLDPEAFRGVADRLLVLSGEGGLGQAVSDAAVTALPSARRHIFAGYDAPGWADLARERTGETAHAMTEFLDKIGATAAGPTAPPRAVPATGAHAGITWRAEGRGPPLLLLPFFLAASQWDPVVPELARRFTVVRLGGPYLGPVATLEGRAALTTYQAMFSLLVDQLAPADDASVLDVGCGSGALDRLLARRLGPTGRVTAVDVNDFLLHEAAALAEAEGLAAPRLRFARGSAVDLPFADATFDCAFSITVLEECDAVRAIAEMRRVVRPGGRIGIAVRAIDMAQWWSFPVPAGLEGIANVPPQSVGRGGVADARLYRLMRDAGLVDLVAFPFLVTLDKPESAVWRYREDAVLAALTVEQRRAWEAARDAAAGEGLLFQANALHCAVARRA